MPADESALCRWAQAAGEELAASLEQAGHLTGNWSDVPLTDVLIEAAMSQALGRLAETGVWGEANLRPSAEFWRAAGGWLQRGSLQHRARFKPRGYPGDYLMLTQIVEQTTCDDPLGAAFDRYFLKQAAPQAVLARTEQLAAALVARRMQQPSEPLHVVSIGSGSAPDICRAVDVLPGKLLPGLRVTLLDIDPEALETAAASLEPRLAHNALNCVRANLFRLRQRNAWLAALQNADLLFCPGLFDYLNAEQAVDMLQLFASVLTARGTMYVGNFAPHHPTRAYMEWIGNWYLIYRTAEELLKLAADARLTKVSVRPERHGVDLFLIAGEPTNHPQGTERDS